MAETTLRPEMRDDRKGFSNATWGVIARVALAVLVFFLGVVGFAQTHPSGQGGGLAGDAVNTLQLIGGQLPKSLDGRRLPVSLTLARIGLPLVTSWATLTLIWLRVRNPVRAALIRRRGDHLVVAGDETLAAQVALAERRRRRPVLVWTSDTSPTWVGRAADAGAPPVGAGAADGDTLKALGLSKARYVLLAGPDGAANAAEAARVLRVASATRSVAEPLMIIARVDDPDLRSSLEARLPGGGNRKRAQLRFISVPDIGARKLFTDYGADLFQRGNGEQPRIVFLGFGALAEAYAIRLLAGGHHSGGVQRNLLILAPDAAERERVFLARHPGAAQITDTSFQVARVDEPALVKDALAPVLAGDGGADGIVVDVGSPERNLSVGMAADAAIARAGALAPPIYIVGVDRLPEGVGPLMRPVCGPGALADPELLLQDKLDVLARSIHDFYLESRLGEGAEMGSRLSMREWEELPEEVRDDNRLIADCYTLKLRDIGARLVPGAGEGFRLEPDELEALAQAEHDRWMAAKLLAGWVHGDQRDDTTKRHPDIVPYEALSEPIKEIDREQIRVMSRVLAASDRHPVRDYVIRVESPHRFADGAWQTLCAALNRSHPDRKPVLLVDFGDAGSRRLAAAAVKGGGGAQLIVDRPADEVVGTLDGDERAQALSLLDNADRIFALDPQSWSGEARGRFALQRAHGRLAPGASLLETVTPASAYPMPAA